MRRVPWAFYLWPGLPQLWLYGSWAGLFLALVSAAVLDLLLLSSFGWSELIADNLRTPVWMSGGAGWLTVVGLSVVHCRWWRARSATSERDGFAAAINHYLRGDYFQAERLLERLLRANARDLEARLMLATLMRHSNRIEEAGRQLETLRRFEAAARWVVEIEQEQELLADAQARLASAGPRDEGQAAKAAPAA